MPGAQFRPNQEKEPVDPDEAVLAKLGPEEFKRYIQEREANRRRLGWGDDSRQFSPVYDKLVASEQLPARNEGALGSLNKRRF